MTELKVEKIRQDMGDFILSADFNVASGERVGLIGPSGSGKTTLLRLIAGLAPLQQGRIRLGERDLTECPAEKREIGLVFQDAALFPALDVLENAAFGLRMKGVGRSAREAEALPWLAKVGLKDRIHSPVQTLSGGERQRVAFVRAILWKPRILLLDEPFSALDVTLRATLRRELVELHQLWPVPLLLVTHDQADLEAIATRCLNYRADETTKVRDFGM